MNVARVTHLCCRVFLDSLSCQVLNPQGVSFAEHLTLQELWKCISDGSKAAEFHSELASTDPYRIGVGLSRMAEAVEAGIGRLKDPNVRRLLKDEFLQRALDEAVEIEASCKALNAGKGSQRESAHAGFNRARRATPASTQEPPKPEDLRMHATRIHTWLAKPSSPLRAIFAILAGGGAFFAAHMAEKTGRAWVTVAGKTAENTVAAALARATGTETPVATGLPADAAGLFP